MVKKSIDAKVRPLANPSLEKTSLLGAARLYISKDSMITLTNGLESNKPCLAEKLSDDPTSDPIIREASLCVLPEKNLSPNVVMMTRAFQDASGFKVGDQIRLSLLESTPDATEVVVRSVADDKDVDAESKYPPCWEYSIALSLGTFTPSHLYFKSNRLFNSQIAPSKSSQEWSSTVSTSTNSAAHSKSSP